MRVIGAGVDIVSVLRMQRLLDRHGQKFVDRWFRAEEVARCAGKARPAECYAARFAAKEAVSKGLRNVWPTGIRWKEIAITNASDGAPQVVLSGVTHRLSRRLGVRRILVSVSHCRDYAVASALLVR